jgi:AP-3 complex subunit beta
MDASTQPLLLPTLSTLLQSPSPITHGASLTAFDAICPDNLAFLHPHYRRICRLLVDADEWGQIVALQILIRYARAMLEKPESSGSTEPTPTYSAKHRQTTNGSSKNTEEEQSDEQDELDPDIELLLHCATPLFQSRNSAVVLGNVKLFYLIAPATHEEVAQDKLVRPLLRLMNGLESDEVRAITAEVCRQVAEERPVSWVDRSSRLVLNQTFLSGYCLPTTPRSCYIPQIAFESSVPRSAY